MANEKTIRTRIQLKSDTELNWRRAVLSTDHAQGLKTSGTSFVPLEGELIVFEPDTQHQYSRLKVGTGKASDNVLALPFIDAGTLNGVDRALVKASSTGGFPAEGSTAALYLDTSTGKLYHYSANTREYSELLNISISVTTGNAANITEWSAGYITEATITGHKLTILNGSLPRLTYNPQQVVTSITQG